MELGKKYRKWELIALPLFFITAPIMGYITWIVLTLVSDFRYSLLPHSDYAFMPSHDLWIIIAIFAGIVGSVLPCYFILRLLLGKRYSEYQKYQSMRFPGNTNKPFAIFFGICVVLCLASIVLLLNYYTIAYPDKLVVNQFWGIGEKEYLYTDITAVRSSMQLKDAKWEHPIYVIEFADGHKWSTRWDLNDWDPKQKDDFFVFVARQSKVEIEAVPAFTESDLK